MGNYINYNKINNKYINFLLRYIKVGKTIPYIDNFFII